ncbi:uncharacterized protein BcabD6B2_12680 [Babesia caballi]|uniref:Uncharacterized protein n=1 Tax=Babesia caballi TaxID=5871 RepID=A0AAV4LQ61_BABCB|nr:hypothetical protein, conserved [Babesia caballi]
MRRAVRPGAPSQRLSSSRHPRFLLQGSQVLASLAELALLHALAHVPVHERALRVHQVELVVHATKDLRNGGGVGNHAHGAHDLRQVAAGNHSGRLVVDADLEASGTPVDELDGALGFDRSHGRVDVLGNDVAAVENARGHVLAVARVALGHHVGRLEGGVGDLGHGQLLVVGLLRADDGRVRGKHEVYAGVGHEVGLELGDVHVQRAVEAQGGGERRNDLGDQTVQVGVGGPSDVEVALANVVDGLVVEHHGHVGVLEQRVRRQHGVVGLHHRRGHARRGPAAEVELALLAVVDREALKHQTAEARARAAAHRVEHEESLEPRAVVSQLADAVQAGVHDVLSHRVVPACEVVGGVLLARDELLGVEEVAVGTGPDLVDHGRLQVDEHAPGHVLPGSGLTEERRERIVALDLLVGGHVPIRLDAVLQAKKFPAQ